MKKINCLISMMFLFWAVSAVSQAGLTASSFSDPFSGSAIDSNWTQVGTSGTLSVVDTTYTLPSNDGQALQIIGKTGPCVLLVNGTQSWVDETVSLSFLPTTMQGNKWNMIGVMADVNAGFNYAGKTSSYVYFKFMNVYGTTYLRIVRNAGPYDTAVQGGFDANPPNFSQTPCPGNPYDGKFHKLTLTVNHHFTTNDTVRLLVATWDSTVVYSYPYSTGPQYDSPRFPSGRVGIMTNTMSNAPCTYLIDNFQATWDNYTPPSPWANITVNQAQTPPTMNGTIIDSEWANATPIVMNNVNMKANQGSEAIGSAWNPIDAAFTGSDANISGTFYFMWDDTYLYGAAKISDATITNVDNYNNGAPPALNNTDGIQLCLDSLNLKSAGSAGTGPNIYIMDVVPGFKDAPNQAGFYQHWGGTTPVPFPNTKVASSVVSGGYQLEWAIKWSDMTPNPVTPAAGTQLGYMTCIMNPDASSPVAAEFWNAGGGTNNLMQPGSWNTFTLAGPAVNKANDNWIVFQ